MGHAEHASKEWQRWLDERVVSLERAQLLRSLRPIVPTQNPIKARPCSRMRALRRPSRPSPSDRPTPLHA